MQSLMKTGKDKKDNTTRGEEGKRLELTDEITLKVLQFIPRQEFLQVIS